MPIAQYLKEIGRGKQGARPLDRARAADLFSQVLDGTVTDLEIGAFCIAMRVKGETPEEMAGFLDATYARKAYRRLAAKGVYVTPTLNMGRILAFLDREDHSRDEGLAYIGPGLRKTYDWRIERAAKATPEQVAARHKEHELSMKVLPMLQAHTVTRSPLA